MSLTSGTRLGAYEVIAKPASDKVGYVWERPT